MGGSRSAPRPGFRLRLCERLVVLALVSLGASNVLATELPYYATLELTVSSGTDPESTLLLTAPFSGMANVDAGVVNIPAGALSVGVPAAGGFAGQLVNGQLVLFVAGGGLGSTCPLIAIQERCIAGGGFGGVMALSGITHLGQDLGVWGSGGNGTGMTTGGLTRPVLATRWTTGMASAWYYILEADITPFALISTGSFGGLPSTHTGTGQTGFRVVTPMVVTGPTSSSLPNARGMATLTVRFAPQPLPLGGGVLLTAVVSGLGLAALRRARRASVRPGR